MKAPRAVTGSEDSAGGAGGGEGAQTDTLFLNSKVIKFADNSSLILASVVPVFPSKILPSRSPDRTVFPDFTFTCSLLSPYSDILSPAP